MNSPKLSERCSSSMSTSRRLNSESREGSLDNSVKEISKSERSVKSEEDWQKRTIIVEKKNGSYGFTLQSYGIHYRKEQEIEVITYVDYVENEGPAAAAGMRPGDVILSINGADVERAEHAAIVDLITACDVRMRMVVIFEDCVRKVELHLKYIKIQRTLKAKMTELEQLNFRERQLLDNNWKSHSLPSQKKKSSPVDAIADNDFFTENLNNVFCRSTLSSENVTVKPSTQKFLYQYLDPRYGACVIQPSLQAGSFIITVGSPRNKNDCHFILNASARPDHELKAHDIEKTHKPHRFINGHGCAPCMTPYNNTDSNSLDAYDLASPCCDPHCVPNTRKKLRRKKECSKEQKRKEKLLHVEKPNQKHESCFYSRKKGTCPSTHCSSRHQTSQCSLQSCIVSNKTGPCENSVSSYSTSLSSDTLYWESERLETKTSPKIRYQSSSGSIKPKSWDNLATKAFGGYGFGYGYLDSGTKHSSRSKSHSRNHSGRSGHSYHEHTYHSHRPSTAAHHYHVISDRSHTHAPTKSSESLNMPKYNLKTAGSETRLTCDCGDSVEYYHRSNSSKSRTLDRSTSGHYSNHYHYNTQAYKSNNSNISSEITRL